uniref:Uncharacterized protein n=1 Tax=Globodera pallida TaxID=36090 RepID=A0A183BIP7_GLOPA
MEMIERNRLVGMKLYAFVLIVLAILALSEGSGKEEKKKKPGSASTHQTEIDLAKTEQKWLPKSFPF